MPQDNDRDAMERSMGKLSAYSNRAAGKSAVFRSMVMTPESKRVETEAMDQNLAMMKEMTKRKMQQRKKSALVERAVRG